MSTGALDSSDDSVARGVGRSLTTIEQLLGIVIIAGKFFDLVFEQRRNNSRGDEVQENGESQKMRQDRRETHVRRSVNDRMLPERESVVQEKNSVWMRRVMYRPGQAGELGVAGILRHERGGCKNEVWR